MAETATARERHLRWWPRFRAWLTTVVERGDWPDSEEYWEELGRHVARAGPAEDVTEDACREAARRLMRKGFPFPSDLHRALPDELQDVFRSALGAPETDRDACARASAGCPECGGSGLTSRRVEHPRHPKGVGVSCCCHRCPMGRWMRSQHQADAPEVARRIIDLRARPDLAGDEPDGPLTPEEQTLTLRAFAAHVGKPVPRPAATPDHPPRRPVAPNVTMDEHGKYVEF